MPRRGVKRQRLIARDGSESPPSTTLKLSEVQGEDPWTTKSKKPRMQMYADTVGEKSSAKQRIFGSIKRQVPNRPRTEIFEEETSEPEIDDSYVDAREKLKSIRVKAASFDTPSNAGRSNIFGSGEKAQDVNGEHDKKGLSSFLKCGLANKDAIQMCITSLNNVMRYAEEDFAKQISLNTGDTDKYPPSSTSYVYANYQDIGIPFYDLEQCLEDKKYFSALDKKITDLKNNHQ